VEGALRQQHFKTPFLVRILTQLSLSLSHHTLPILESKSNDPELQKPKANIPNLSPHPHQPPKIPSMRLKLSPSIVEDTAEYKRMGFSAFAKSHLNKALYYGSPEIAEAGLAWNIEKTIEADGLDVSERKMKVVDEDTGKIVGQARWLFPHKFTSEEDARKKSSPLNELPPMANKKLAEAFFRDLHERRAKNTNSSKDFILNSLAVEPTYQGRGVGRMLVQWGMDIADEMDAGIYLESSPEGHEFYRRLGFEDLEGEVIEINLGEFGYVGMEGEDGGDGVHRTFCVIRGRRSERG